MPEVIYRVQDGVAWVTLNRPERRNALTPEMIVRLAEAWAAFRADPDARVALLTGTGDQAFCAGADLARLIPLITRDRPPQDDWDRRLLADPGLARAAFLRDVETFKPIVAAVNGLAFAAGMELLLATDVRVVSSEARLALSEVGRGLVPAAGSLARLARQIPWAAAMEIVLTAEPVSADEALRLGLVNRVVDPGEVLAVAERLARRIAANGPLAVRKAKEAMIRSSGRPLEDAFAVESECAREVWRSQDAKEGPRAFLEKRPPRFTGR